MAIKLTAHQPDHAAIVQLSATVPWLQILAWIEKYGFPVLMQVLAAILPLLQGKTIDVTKLVTWIETALAALVAGQPIPPLPTIP